MEFTFLGTSCMVPTKDRNHASLLFSFQDENILFDCGEGTQRQLKMADFSLMKIKRIMISHWHGDHVLGLPGLMQTMASNKYSGVLEIYGPKGTKERIDKMFEAFVFDAPLNFKVIEIKEGVICETETLKIEAYSLEHGMESYGFKIIEKDKIRIKVPYIKKLGMSEGPLLGKLQEGKDVEFKGKKVLAKDATYVVKGKIIGIITDTVFCSNCLKIAKDADLLISEAAYDSSLSDKAEEYKHMTAMQAGQIASQNNVKKLVLFHYSQRYKTTDKILEDAKTVFEDTIAAYDLMKVKL